MRNFYYMEKAFVMKWTDEAEKAVSRVPFFVRKRVRKRVEEEARSSGDRKVRMEHVRTCIPCIKQLHCLEVYLPAFKNQPHPFIQ
ncbi:PCP reductase family protein [Thermodesulfobacteriota bacterium]